MKKFSKILCTFFALVLVVSAFCVTAGASSAYQTYTYDIKGKALYSPDAYTAHRTVNSDDMGLELAIENPGDMLTEDTHTLLYIGNGYVLDCNGYKYDIENGVDQVELNGITRKMKTIAKTLEAAVSDYIVTRPLDYYTKDYDGNIGNDIIKFEGEIIEITDPTYSRIEYPAMEIDRTVDITPYGTAVQNETLTYTVKVSNKSNEDNFLKWKRVSEKGYAGEDYIGVVITEAIPEGTTFVSASEGYTFVDGVLSWTVDIPLGYSAEISYTVKVTAEVGSTITSDGGKVATIPSNSISNRVGYTKITEEQKEILGEISESDLEQWMDSYGTDLDFAEGIYNALGIALQLPSVQEIIENMFT